MRGMDSQNSSLKPQSVAEGAAQGPLRAPLRLVGEVSLISALAFLPLGIYQPFFPLWLAGQNFDAEMIGLVLSLNRHAVITGFGASDPILAADCPLSLCQPADPHAGQLRERPRKRQERQ